MASQIDEETLADWQEGFQAYEQGGVANPQQLRLIFLGLGKDLGPDQLQNIHRGGSVDFSQFKAAMSGMQQHVATPQEVVESFAVFDREQNGLISVPEVRYMMTNQGEKLSDLEVNMMIAEADEEGNGVIDYARFAQLMATHT